MENGFYKVCQTGYTFITAVFFNPDTGEVKREVVRDYDYADGSRDNDELYDMPINEEVRRMWQHHEGVILKGDTIKVVKGRKVKIGTVATVVDIRPYKDCYGRTLTMYAYLSTGERTNIQNCELVPA